MEYLELLLSAIKNGSISEAFQVLWIVLHQTKVFLWCWIAQGQLIAFLLAQKKTSPLAQFKATESGWTRLVFALLSSLLPVLGGIRVFLTFGCAAVVIQIFNRYSFLMFQLKHCSAVNLSWLGIKRYKPAVLIQSVSWDHYCWKLGHCVLLCVFQQLLKVLSVHTQKGHIISLLERNLLRYTCFHTQLKGYAPIISGTSCKSGVSAGTASRCRVLLLILLWKHTQMCLCAIWYFWFRRICIFLSSLNTKIRGQGLLFSFVQFGSFGSCS